MPRFLLDTNIASYLFKRYSPVLDHRVSLVRQEEMAISTVTEAEILFGLALAPPEAKFHPMAHAFLARAEILPWDSHCAQTYGKLAAQQKITGKPLEGLDTLIAAHALACGLTLITNDQAFRQVPGLTVEDWTQPA